MNHKVVKSEINDELNKILIKLNDLEPTPYYSPWGRVHYNEDGIGTIESPSDEHIYLVSLKKVLIRALSDETQLTENEYYSSSANC